MAATRRDSLPPGKSKTYTKTHPWLTFSLDLNLLPYTTWMDLGAVQSKIEHVANALLAPEVADQLHVLYLAKGVHATTAIEGNTLSEEQVRSLIQEQLTLPPSREYQAREAENIAQACNAIALNVLSGRTSPWASSDIQEFNRRVFDGLTSAEEVRPGQFRRHSVVVANYRGAPAEDCPWLTERLCAWLNTAWEPSAESRTGFAVLKAIAAHVYLAWIHPFGDGNGRTARLIEFQILLAAGVPSVAAHLLSNFYNQTRDQYYRELAKASQGGGKIAGFLQYAIRGLHDALDVQIDVIRQHQWDVAWRDHVYQRFRGQRGIAAERRRSLALELGKTRGVISIPLSAIRSTSPELAASYATRTTKTLSRDIHELVQRKLVVVGPDGVTANGAVLARLLPDRAEVSASPDGPRSGREKKAALE